MRPDQPEQQPERPSWLYKITYLAGMVLLTYGIVGLAGWLLRDHLPPGPLLAVLLAVVAVISVAAVWLEPYAFGTHRWQRQVRLAVADLLGVLRTTRSGEPLLDKQSDLTLRAHRHRIPPVWVVERVSVDSICQASVDLDNGEPLSTIPYRRFIVTGRSASVFDHVIPIRYNGDGEVEEVPTPRAGWREAFRSHRLSRRLGTLDASPAELRELAEQLARAVPVPEGGQDAA